MYMCLAIPGKIKSIDGRKVLVQYPHEERYVLNSDEPIEVGDYVMVQMGVILKKIPEEQAKVSWEAWTSVTA
jgi:hydrogenase assembly chaperone HypC/HupF